MVLGWQKEHHGIQAPESRLRECAQRCDLAILALAA